MFYIISVLMLAIILPLLVITAEQQHNKARRVLWWVFVTVFVGCIVFFVKL